MNFSLTLNVERKVGLGWLFKTLVLNEPFRNRFGSYSFVSGSFSNAYEPYLSNAHKYLVIGSKCQFKQSKKCIHAKPFKLLVIGACSWFGMGVHFLEFVWLVAIFESYVIRCGRGFGSQTNMCQWILYFYIFFVDCLLKI
jgi:hypothetical protein